MFILLIAISNEIKQQIITKKVTHKKITKKYYLQYEGKKLNQIW